MNILSILLDVAAQSAQLGAEVNPASADASQAVEAAGNAAAGAANTAPAGGMGSMWIMLILIFVVMYFFMIRPQRKQQKELQNFRAGLKKGDKVVTAGGIYGTVDQVEERSVLIRVDGDVKLRVAKESLVKDFSDTQQR